jgi:NTE family protein
MRKKLLALTTLLAALGLTFTVAACSEMETRTEHQDSGRAEPHRYESTFDNPDSHAAADKSANNEVGGSNPATTIGSPNQGAASTMAPTPNNLARADKRVAVILGPGGFKTFAHAGVIKELRKANIPIHAVLGIEWGALVGALYAQRGQIHEAEWKLYKLEKLDLSTTGFFSRRHQMKSIKDLEGFLNENLESRDVTQTAIPFSCPSLSLSRGTLAVQRSGPLPRAVAKCLALPPLFSPSGDDVADVLSLPDLIGQLRGEGYNVIILVNVLGDGNLFDKTEDQGDYATEVLWDEVRRQIWQTRPLVTDVIEVSTHGIGLGDFESRKLLVTAGESAGERAARALLTKYGF